ncbi:MAG: AMP-binding protein [Chloroflexi bacterium]|nr:AMP-binding protein [Chloroflexota bacterium]
MKSQKPWIDKYDPDVPGSLDYPKINIQDLLFYQASNYPDRIALLCGEFSISYRNLVSISRQFAQNLVYLGLNPGQCVGICLPNIPQFVIAFLGTLLAGGVVSAMNPAYTPRELEFKAGMTCPQFLVGLTPNRTALEIIAKNKKIQKLILTDLVDLSDPNKKNELSNCVIDFSTMTYPGSKEITLPKINPDQPAVYQFSGGTTGIPKAAVILHKNLVANVLQFRKWMPSMKDGQEVFLTVIPLYHVYGMVLGLNFGLAIGATIILAPDAADLTGILDLIPKNLVSFFPGVPNLYRAINKIFPSLEPKIDFRSLKACISGSAPLLNTDRVQFIKLTGARLVEGYGLSEAPTATHCNPFQGENREGSIGLPLPDVDCKIVDIEDYEREVPLGNSGELIICGPQIMKEYLNQTQETGSTLRNGWLFTGDIARMDRDGYFYIIGRKKELIKVNGLQVWPLEVEEAIFHHPKVKEVAVAGVQDSTTGERVKAWLVLKESGSIDLFEVQRFCRDSLVAYKIPSEIEIIDSLPRSAIGKILRRELVELHNNRLIKNQGA